MASCAVQFEDSLAAEKFFGVVAEVATEGNNLDNLISSRVQVPLSLSYGLAIYRAEGLERDHLQN